MGEVLFDARSAGLQRTTGWERYARELSTSLREYTDIDIWQPRTESTKARVGSDWFRLPKVARGYRVVHLPTFPPTPAVRGPRLVYTLHDLTWWLYPETASCGGRTYYRRLAERTIHRAHVVTVSEAVREEALNQLDLDPGSVTAIYPGVRAFPEGDPATPARERPYLLTVATMEPRKNLDRLADAFQVSGLARDIDLVIVGRLAWGKRPPGVTALGHVTDEDLGRLYRDALGAVFPAVYEGFGLPVAEAMLCRTPVACSDIAAFREVTGGRAIFFDPMSVDAIADALNSLVTPTPDAAQIDAAEAKARTFDWSVTATRLAGLYEKVGNRG